MEPLTLVDRNGTRLAIVLPGSMIVVGRSTECDVNLPDPTVSRRHAELRASDGEIHVRDLNSRNGTFRNGVRIDTARVRAGDVVSFGVFAVRVEQGAAVPGSASATATSLAAPREGLVDPSPPPALRAPRGRVRPRSGPHPAYRVPEHAPAHLPASPAPPEASDATSGGYPVDGAEVAAEAAPEPPRAVEPAPAPAAEPEAPPPAPSAPIVEPEDGELPVVAERPAASPHELTARRLGLLLDVTKALGRAGGGPGLLDQIVQHAVQTTDADRAALVVIRGGVGDTPDPSTMLRPAVARDRWGGDLTGVGAASIPRSIVRAAVDRRRALLSVDASADPRFGGQSVLLQRVRASMCAPLLASDGTAIGALYVDSASPTHTFGEEDLDYLTAFAGVASAAIETARLAERVRAELMTRQNFERYFAPPVAERIAKQAGPASPGGERRTVAVLFADLRGFTRIATTMPPDVMAETLSEFFGAMVECVFRHGGTLDKFIGDAVMAQWGAPESASDDADRAMRAAIDMMAALAELNARWKAEGAPRPELAMGIGLAYGDVFAGNIGSERRLEFTVIGEVVNQASRLCDAAAPGEILLNETLRVALREPPPLTPVPTPYMPGRPAAYAVTRAEP
jgi:adenylate cyclase